MSSKPSVEGVAALRELLLRKRDLDREIVDLQQKEKRLGEADRERHEVEGLIAKQLDDMDCASSGNSGWLARFTWMLDQLERQAWRAPQNSEIERCPICLSANGSHHPDCVQPPRRWKTDPS